MGKKSQSTHFRTQQLTFEFEQPLEEGAATSKTPSRNKPTIQITPAHIPATHLDTNHAEDLRIKRKKHADDASSRMHVAFWLALATLAVKGGIKFNEASFIFFKIDNLPSQTFAGLLGLATFCFTLLAAHHSLCAWSLHSQLPKQRSSFHSHWHHGLFERASSACLLGVCLITIIAALCFACFDVKTAIVVIWAQWFPSPWQTEIVPQQ